MEKRQSEKILDVLEKNRSRAAIGFLLLFLGSAVLLFFVLTGRTRAPEPETEPEIELPPVSDVRVRRLDGVLVSPGEDEYAPFGVMVENHPEAWPLSGISKAQVVIEAQVEGGITRLLTLFDPSTEAEEIGPVRSARPYYVEWADSWHALYAHVGGSPNGLALIREKDNLIDLDQFRWGNTFWRSILRFAPHNVYTSTELLNAFVAEQEITDRVMPIGWQFLPKEEGAESGNIVEIDIPYGGVYDVTWKYDGENDHYVRYQNGRMQEDKDGSVVTAKNIIVVETDAKVVDAEGRLDLRTTGEGNGIGFRNGHRYDFTWHRSGDGIIEFRADGGAYALEPGTTWVEVVTDVEVTVTERVDR